MFGFTFDSETEPEIIALMDDVRNIESPAGIIYRTIRLINVNDAHNLLSAIENAAKIYENNGFICMLDDTKSIVARTFISNIRILKSKKNNITLYGQVWCHPNQRSKKLFKTKFDEILEIFEDYRVQVVLK